MTQEQKVAVVGCGYWGKNLVRNFQELGALAAVCDQNAELGGDFSKKYQVPLRTLPDILSDSAITGVVVATPGATHATLVREALLAGKHVFVEKPMSHTADEGAALCDLAAKMQRVLMVGHLLQYHPAFLKLKAMCREGALGRINYIASNRLNLGKIGTRENALWSFAPHDVSMILALLNDAPVSVSAVGHCYLHQAVADVTTTHLTFASGQAAHIHVSWLYPIKEQRLVVIGEKAMAVFDDGQNWSSKLCLYDHEINWRDGVPVPTKSNGRPIAIEEQEPLRLECQHFLDCIAEGATPRTDGQEGLRVLRVLDAAQQSINEQRPVAVAAEADGHTSHVHPTACIDEPCEVGEGTKIWHFSHILKNSRIGRNCSIGQNVVIGPNVAIGDGCKIQNNVSVYDGVTLEDNVFCGPSMVFTNVINPRAEISRRDEFADTVVRTGATIGANATIICGVEIGRYAFIGAGAVVTNNVPAFALMLGNPARHVGDMCVCGERLPDGDGPEVTCGACQRRFERAKDGVRLVE